MAAPTITNTMTSGNTALAAEINTNFQDLIDGISDGTKDLTINKLITDSTVTMSGTTTNLDATSHTIGFKNASKWTANTITELDLAACQKIDMGGTNIAQTITPDVNTLYPQTIPKAFARVSMKQLGFEETTGLISVVGGSFNFNYSASSYQNATITVEFLTPMADSDYVVILTGPQDPPSGPMHATVISQTVSNFIINYFDAAGAKVTMDGIGQDCRFAVFGNQ